MLKWTKFSFAILFVKNRPFEGAHAIGWLSLIMSILKFPVDALEILMIFDGLLKGNQNNKIQYLSLLETVKLRLFLLIGGVILWHQNKSINPAGPLMFFSGFLAIILSIVTEVMEDK